MTAIDLACRESGDGMPLVLLHAFPLSSALFPRETTVLPGWRTLTPGKGAFWGSSELSVKTGRPSAANALLVPPNRGLRPTFTQSSVFTVGSAIPHRHDGEVL